MSFSKNDIKVETYDHKKRILYQGNHYPHKPSKRIQMMLLFSNGLAFSISNNELTNYHHSFTHLPAQNIFHPNN